eukprot:COSAG05_NODE_213_length_13909_cov_7.240550_2_plen_62_part_00
MTVYLYTTAVPVVSIVHVLYLLYIHVQARFAIKPGEMGNGKKRARCVRYDNLMSGNMSYNM